MNISGLDKRQLRILLRALERQSSATFQSMETCKPRPGLPDVIPGTLENLEADIAAIDALYDEVRKGKP